VSYEAWGEPDDFDDQCPDCDGGAINREAMTIDGIHYPAIVNQVCETCNGEGVLEFNPWEDDGHEE
jgi:DnaJ-class molecular chaperone